MSSIYSEKLVKCGYNYHTGKNQHCRNLELPSCMYETARFGLVCYRCARHAEKFP